MKNTLFILFVLSVTAATLAAQSEDPFGDMGDFTDMDALFDTEEAVEEVEEPLVDLGEDLETSEFTWGGFFDLKSTGLWRWADPPWEEWRESDSESLEPGLWADLFFDSRPEKDFRVFGKFELSYPESSITIKELFADFDWEDKAYFRIGKQTVNWGVGFLFSPADLINLTPIDPLDFEAEREGPIAWKTQMPLGKHNAYLYLLYTGEESLGKMENLAAAPRVEFVLGSNELGLGGYFQKGRTPKVMTTLTGPLGDLDYFGEILVQYGADSDFYTAKTVPSAIGENPSMEDLISAYYDTEQREDEIFFAGTAGINYWKESWDFRLLAQYYYDQERFSFRHPEEQGLHQGAAYLSFGTIADSDFDFTALWMGLITEGTGMVRWELTWRPLEMASLSTGMNCYYGDYRLHTTGQGLLPDDYNAEGNTRLELFLTVRLGYGGF